MTKTCYAQAHMTPAEFGLYTQYRILSAKSDELFCDGRRTAERFADTSKSTIYRLRASLVDKKWLEEKCRGKRGKDGLYSVTTFRVLTHDQWVQKYGCKECKTKVFDGLQPVPSTGMDNISPVPSTGMTCPKYGNEPVPSTGHSIKKNQLEDKPRLKTPATPSNTSKKQKEDGRQSLIREFVPPVPSTGMVSTSPVPSTGMDVPPVTPASQVDSIPAMAEILAELPKAEQAKLFRKNERYTREDAWHALQRYRAS